MTTNQFYDRCVEELMTQILQPRKDDNKSYDILQFNEKQLKEIKSKSQIVKEKEKENQTPDIEKICELLSKELFSPEEIVLLKKALGIKRMGPSNALMNGENIIIKLWKET